VDEGASVGASVPRVLPREIRPMSAPSCHYCGTDRELRPYGPDGAHVCNPCVRADPAREAEAKRRFLQALDRAQRHTGAAQLTPAGPVPYLTGRRR